MESCISQLKPYSVEYRIEDRDGDYHWMLDTAIPRTDDNNQSLGYIGTALNITERKNVENALRESEGLLDKAQKLANVGYWKLIPDTGEVTGSDELFEIFGFPRDEATLDAFVEVVHPEDREMDVTAIQRGIEHGEGWDIEHRLICKDGTEKWVFPTNDNVKSS